MSDLIEVKPVFHISIECLFCRSGKIVSNELLFQGIHILADCRCEKCEKEFYHTLPVGHDRMFPIAFDKKGKHSSFDRTAASWLANPLIDSFFRARKEEREIEKKVFFERENAIILNCLDSCFGHVFTKLWNAQQLIKNYPEMAVIVLVPKKMEWLVPMGVAEVWTVAAPLHSLKSFISNLDGFVKKEFSRFRKVHLSPVHVHLDTEKLAIEEFIKVKRFNLIDFQNASPQITFITRDDRFWHGNSLEHFLFKACVKFKLLDYFKRYFVWRQNQFLNKIARAIVSQFGDVKFYATGICKAGGLSPLITDRRSKEITNSTEKDWCNIYAQSHVVIGIHGSNMLIPSSLAAGFIELLPRHKIPHLTEDLVLQYPSRYSLFLGRHLDHFASAKLVSLHACSMIKNFPFLFKNTEKEIRSV